MLFSTDMEESIRMQVLKELVLDDEMQCLACNVKGVNLPTWESHKKGKRYYYFTRF